MKIVLVFCTIVAASIVFFLVKKPEPTSKLPVTIVTPSPEPTSFTASFEIYTNGTKRIFTDTKYHNLSTNVYISSPNPGTVYVKGGKVTWTDFFSTLPMKLAKDCLTTGTGQVFCTNETKSLKFFINGSEDPDALDREINSNDNLIVKYE
jgi:hypothetical protein